jgi:hypothetical protein
VQAFEIARPWHASRAHHPVSANGDFPGWRRKYRDIGAFLNLRRSLGRTWTRRRGLSRRESPHRRFLFPLGIHRRQFAPCLSPAVRGRSRCRMHDGAEGSGAQPGDKNAWKHGRNSASYRNTAPAALLARDAEQELWRLKVRVRMASAWRKGRRVVPSFPAYRTAADGYSGAGSARQALRKRRDRGFVVLAINSAFIWSRGMRAEAEGRVQGMRKLS